MLIAASEAVAWAAHHLSGGTAGWPQGGKLWVAGDAWDIYASDMAVPSGWLRSAARRPQAEAVARLARLARWDEHTSELQSLMRNSDVDICLIKKNYGYRGR